MQRRLLPLMMSPGICLLAMCVFAEKSPAEDSAAVKALFANPPREYSSGPLWVWNDRLTEEQIKSTLQDLAGQKVKQVWVHPRPGLMTPYLSDEWFRMWRVALKEAERLDMNVWIYDENSYPSGFAGGLVPEAMPESRGSGLHFSEVTNVEKPGDDVVAVYRLTDDACENVTEKAKTGAELPEGKYLVATLRRAPSGGWFGGKYYVDLLHPGVTEKFIEITMGAYKRELGEHFGDRIPGVFTDEPHLTPAGGIHWTERLPRDFKKRWGYDLMDHLPSLVRPIGDYKRVRHNYQQFLLEEFIDCWAKPFYEYCEKNDLEFTGHYWEHGWPGASHGGDNMAMYAWHQRPSIDNLMNEYSEGVHGQFGNARTVKELASVANQMGRKRTLCETYGAGGWDLRFEDMKRIGDWLYVLGVNTLNEHLSYITIRGARKRDHPQSFSYHTPWWEGYHKMAGYFTRLSLALSSGKQVNHILLLEPTTSTWMYQPDGSGGQQLNTIGNAFQDMVNEWERQQVEYDIGCEDIMGRHGAVRVLMTSDAAGHGERDRVFLEVAKRWYHTLVLPPHTENVNTKTADLLEEYVNAGGTVFCCGDPPTHIDGSPSDRLKKLAEKPSWRTVKAEDLPAKMRVIGADGLTIRRQKDDQGILFHHRRRLDDGEILFLVNTSIESPSAGTIRTDAAGIERWDLDTGRIEPYPSRGDENNTQARFRLPPCGSLLLFLSDKPIKGKARTPTRRSIIRPTGPPKIKRIEPNVLTLDYVDVTAGGEKKEKTYVYGANRFVWQKHGLGGNPWDSAVQFRDELITKKFPAESGFEATYRFTIAERVPSLLSIVIERPDLYTITCNGKPIKASDGDWWLDKSFGRIDIASAARIGANEVTVKASPMTMYHELESAYLLGDFSLTSAESGFLVGPAKPLALDAAGWNEQGHPFYAAGVAYTEKFDVAKPSGRYVVRLGKWRGSVAKVIVNGKPAGYIGYPPWECDVTDRIVAGPNAIEVVVIGTLKNTLGPHHAGAVTGRAWPNMFHNAPQPGPPPGEKYHTLGYGLFEPFVLRQESE